MNDKTSFLDRFQVPDGPAEAADDEPAAEFPAYALARGARPAVAMLELRTRAGNAVAFDYGWLAEAGFDPSAGITLRFDRKQVTLTGRHLRPLFNGLLRKRVLWVQEQDPLAAAAQGAHDTAVTGIAVAPGAEPVDG